MAVMDSWMPSLKNMGSMETRRPFGPTLNPALSYSST